MQAPAKRSPERGQPDPEVRRLGEALRARVEDVLSHTAARRRHAARGSDPALDAVVRESFERIGRSSTIAVARWMAGGDPKAGRDTGRKAWHTYGQLAAQSAVPLNAVTKRCLYWRDAVAEVLRESAADMGISSAALGQALAMVQRTLDVTLVRMCEAFEQERARTDEELTRRQDELAFMATHDQLTGLPNRTLILDRGEQMMGRARRLRTSVAALVMDVDNFTNINDTLGHAAGDELLKAIAARLDGIVRDTDALGRIGGDEFVVLVDEVSQGAGAELAAERLKVALKAPFMLGDGEHTGLLVTASIGVATGERASMGELLRDADIALHRAKRDGKHRHVVFECGHAGRGAESHGARDGSARRARARRVLPALPADIRPARDAAHRSRGADPLEMSVARSRAAQRLHSAARGDGADQSRSGSGCSSRPAARARDGAMLDTRSASRSTCPRASSTSTSSSARCATRSRTAGCEAGALTIEITETTLMRNPEETARRLRAIKDLGVRIAIDDFGTGYSSFAHLRRFPVDALKIDRSFISQLAENPEGETLLRTLVQLGKALSIETLAEGIECQHQLALLREERCDGGQGFLFARPLAAGAAEAFLQNWRTSTAPEPAPEPAPTSGVPVLAVVPPAVGRRARRLLVAGGESG